MRVIAAKHLKDGMVLTFNMPRQELYIDSVEDTRDGEVLVRCGYSKGDDSITHFYKQEENVLILD